MLWIRSVVWQTMRHAKLGLYERPMGEEGLDDRDCGPPGAHRAGHLLFLESACGSRRVRGGR